MEFNVDAEKIPKSVNVSPSIRHLRIRVPTKSRKMLSFLKKHFSEFEFNIICCIKYSSSDLNTITNLNQFK